MADDEYCGGHERYFDQYLTSFGLSIYPVQFMETRYRSHAVERMVQRGISPQEVEGVLRDPDGVIGQSMDKVIAHKHIDGRPDNSITVVAVRGSQAWDVVTVMVNFEVRE